MDPTIVGDHVRHRKHPGVSLLGEHVDAHPGQRPGRRDEVLVHPMHAPRDAADAVQVQARNRGARQDAGPGAGRDQRAHRLRGQFDVGVEVHPGKRAARLVAEPERMHLAGNGCLHDTHADLPGGLRGAVGARVGDDDDVELAGGRAGEHPAQVVRDDGFLVVCRHDDADDRPLRDIRTRRLGHRTAPQSPSRQDSRP
jgi:hypothetical protein